MGNPKLFGPEPRAGTGTQQAFADAVLANMDANISQIGARDGRLALNYLREMVIAVANILAQSGPGRINLEGWAEDIPRTSSSHLTAAILLITHHYPAGPTGALRFLADTSPVVRNVVRAFPG